VTLTKHTHFRLVSRPSVPGLLPPLLQPLSPTPPCGRYRSTPYCSVCSSATRRRHRFGLGSERHLSVARNITSQRVRPTREEPGAPSTGDSTDASHHQGAPPAPMELGAPPTGKTESSHHQGTPPTHTAFGAPSTSDSCQSQGAPPTQSELGAPSASQLGKPQGATPDQAEIGSPSNCRRLAWIEEEFNLQNHPTFGTQWTSRRLSRCF
jgi:hypothetical protein